MKTFIPKESDEQALVIQWWRLQYPAADRLLFAIPNGGLRNVITAARLKREGVKPGVADLFLALPVGNSHGLFIEMKRKRGGQQSVDQKNFELIVTGIGYKYLLAKGADEAIMGIQAYINNAEEDVCLRLKIR